MIDYASVEIKETTLMDVIEYKSMTNNEEGE